LSHESLRALFHKAFSFVVSSFDRYSPARSVSQASLSVCSGVVIGAAVETGLFSGLSTGCLRASVAAAPTRFDLRRIRGVRGRVVPMSWLLFKATKSKQKGRRGKRQPIHNLYQNLRNLQLHRRMARRSERMDAGSACIHVGFAHPMVNASNACR
jgi:hypothetical protein